MQSAQSIVVLAAVCCLGLPALGQAQDRDQAPERRGGGRQAPRSQMTTEQSKAAWEIQAKSVASQLGVVDAQAMTTVYVTARKSYRDAVGAARAAARKDPEVAGGGDDGGQGPVGRNGRNGRGRRGSDSRFAKVRDAEREKLQSALEPYVQAENLKTAVSILGSFDRSYDGMTNTLLGFKLGDEKTMKAMASLNESVVARGKLAGMDRENRRDAMMDMRDDLMAGLSVVLDSEQMEALQQSMRRGGRRGGQRPQRERDI
jgi:hypothetical protein